MIEKPIALTIEQSKEIIEECKSNDVKLAVGLMMRFGAYHMKMREL
ncbi:MAG: gfo/Idh/MocA family oxidoreductase, partial [Clostridia bacterium]|nr:gfo/Idh/MocA family oxidoreductase [Clostridia bacterium]